MKNTKKKLVKPIVFKKKNDSPLVEIKNKMTVNDLTLLLNRTSDNIFEAMSYINGAQRYEKLDEAIDDIRIIKQIVAKCGYRFKVVSNVEKAHKVKNETMPKHIGPNWDTVTTRPPVVTIMGHVDHGKTTLLDSLRCSHVVDQEFGGITQHIGAFSVKMKAEAPSETTTTSKNPESFQSPSPPSSITFLDTPGHAAFSSMRERGAMVTDLVVLVVAADDGVMKQTEESIRFAKEAQVPIIVAINKIDKPTANIESTKNSLLNHGIQLEDLGGEVQSVDISALKGDNLDSLQECILAQAELMQLRADENCHVEAVCVESRLDPGRGKLATALIQHGTLKKGDVLVAGKAWAKVRGMFDDQGKPVHSVKPGHPVEVIGWRSLPSAGEAILQVESEQEAKRMVGLAEERENDEKVDEDEEVIKKKMMLHQEEYNETRRQKLEKGIRIGRQKSRSARTKESEPTDDCPKLAIIVKGDVDGSVEAILDVLETYDSKQCRLDLLSYGVGAVTENDVEVAGLFKGTIYAFNVATHDRVSSLAKQHNVPIVNFNIIYRLLSHLQLQLNQQLPPAIVEQVVGEANVLASFVVTEGKRKVSVAGCRCTKGLLNKKMTFKLVRDGEVMAQGNLQSLKHHKNEVDSIKVDVECGLSFSDQRHQPQAGDQVVCYELISKKQTIQWDLDFL